MARILNTRVTLVGIQPEVAITLLDMGLELSGIDAAMDIEHGLAVLGYRLSTIDRRNGTDRRGGRSYDSNQEADDGRPAHRDH